MKMTETSNMAAPVEDWKIKAARGQQILHNSIRRDWTVDDTRLPSLDQIDVGNLAELCGTLSTREVLITRSTATELVHRMSDGTYSAEEVTVAFLKRATIAQQLTNFATEFLVDEALSQAKALDKEFHRTGKLAGPLHGVLISVKEHCSVAGKTCNAGFVAWVDKIPPSDSHMVALLRAAGAVIHVRTNQPQSLMHLDCSNNITGTTCNPRNRKLSQGDSSGGEGVSLATRAAALGVGSDIGGSIRVPAAFCGVYGLRPTTCRLPLGGMLAAGAGQESVRGVVGPLSNSIEDLNLFMRVILDQHPWRDDPILMPVPWRQPNATINPRLRIAIMEDDGMVRPHPPILRALNHAKQKLKAASIDVVRWDPLGHVRAYEIVKKKLYYADGGSNLRQALAESGEPAKPLTQFVLDIFAELITAEENWKLNSERDQLKIEYNRQFTELGVDAVLCPA
ncbi:Amidase-like protein 9 [Elsinoe fawcettii]|nr:Amidase-like protein 9 [Elsinoe fawcettii]